MAQAGTVETRDGHVYEGQVRLADAGQLIVQQTNGTSQEVPLAQVQRARLKPAPTEVEGLSRGWRVENLCRVQAHSIEQEGVFTLRVTGGAVTDPQQQAVHFVHRIVRGDAEMVAKAQTVSGPANSLAGVMLRENLEPQGGFVLLAVSPDHQLRLEWREYGWHAVHHYDLGNVALPLWLKLEREEKTKNVTASRSDDGTNWQEVGHCSLGCKTEPFPEGSDTWRPKLHAGLGIISPGSNAVATALLAQVSVTARGLLGEYFADSRFHDFRFSRPDDKLEFYWGDRSPAPDIPQDHFAVRWTGQLEAPLSENYRFDLEADNDAWLWIGDAAEPILSSKREDKDKEWPLQAGRKYNLKIEFKEGVGAASLRLSWTSPRLGRQLIPASQLSYTFHASSPDEERELPALRNQVCLAQGIWLRHGSLLAGRVEAADEHTAWLPFAGQDKFALPKTRIARIVLQKPRRPMPVSTADPRVGLLLKNGDFLEGEFRSLRGGSVTVQSVLFGQRKFWIENGEVVALLLQPCALTPAPFEVRLVDGSVLRADRLRPAGQTVRVEDTTLGELVIPESELLEIGALADDSAAP